jgi:DNA modification methylase
LCFNGWREGADHRFFGPAGPTDLWSAREAGPRGGARPAERPVEVAARAVEYSSRPGENVLDLFGGGGWTLIAAEQPGRRAFLTEPDAPRCDATVARWEAFTGREAGRAAAS